MIKNSVIAFIVGIILCPILAAYEPQFVIPDATIDQNFKNAAAELKAVSEDLDTAESTLAGAALLNSTQTFTGANTFTSSITSSGNNNWTGSNAFSGETSFTTQISSTSTGLVGSYTTTTVPTCVPSSTRTLTLSSTRDVMFIFNGYVSDAQVGNNLSLSLVRDGVQMFTSVSNGLSAGLVRASSLTGVDSAVPAGAHVWCIQAYDNGGNFTIHSSQNFSVSTMP